jgi:hypothetical protein
MNPEKLKYYLQKTKMNKLQRRKKKKKNKEKQKRKEERNFMVHS